MAADSLNDDCWRRVLWHADRSSLLQLRLVSKHLGELASAQRFRVRCPVDPLLTLQFLELDTHQWSHPWPEQVESLSSYSRSLVVETTYRHLAKHSDQSDALFEKSVQNILKLVATPLASTLRTLVIPFSVELCDAINAASPPLLETIVRR